METASLDDFVALNEQLAALVQAGVPLDVGLSRPEVSTSKALERIHATIVRRVNRGETLVEALEGDEHDVPGAYRSMVQFGLHTGNLSAALNGSSRLAESADDSRFAFESALVYPLIVCSLAYIGLVGFCLFFVPTLEGMYESARIAAGPGLRALQLLRDTLPYWAAIPPIVLLVLVAALARAKSRRATGGASTGGLFHWLPGVSRITFQERCAAFAASLAELLDSNVPLPDALPIAADSCGDSDLRDGARSLAAAIEAGQMPADDSPIALQFPPFMRWALWRSEETTGRARALEIAARMYRETAQQLAERLQTVAPMAALVVVGGTVTLLYGLALFVPVVELLHKLSA
jgi:general secretion pathway protein F